MATVTGKSSTKIDQLLNNVIVDGDLDSAGSLTFTRKGGGTINAGSLGVAVVNATINAAKRLIFTKMDGSEIDAGSVDYSSPPLASWPVTSVFIGMSPVNPATLLGGGTWVRIAKGKMLVGVDETDASFDAVRETGGSKSKTLVTANLAAHAHTNVHNHSIDHSHQSRSSPDAGGTTLSFNRGGASGQIIGGGMIATHDGVSGGASAATGSTGSGTPFDVMNPYITTYIWERTA